MRPTTTIVLVLLLAAAHGGRPAAAQETGPTRELPATFEANRIFVHTVTAEGDSLRLYTDTGGGLYLTRGVAERLDLSVRDTTLRGRRHSVASFPRLRSDSPVPAPAADVVPVRPERGEHALLHPEADGLLGQAWFGGRTWTLDYPSGEMLLHVAGETPEAAPEHTVSLGFPVDSAGRRRTSYPSIEATIAGETRPYLLDTGATILLTDRGRLEIGAPRRRGGSYVVASVFERWREEHPEWRVVEGASRYGNGTPLIRVPEVTIAGHTVGPVWFARRPDANFRTKMAAMMDRPVDGALGGSLLRHFAVTVDYPAARATFRLPAEDR